MKKQFCDKCEAEITKSNWFSINGSLEVEVADHKFHVKIAQNEIAMNFDVCRYCILDAINQLDDRPKERQ
jgi:hypothetical protein